MKPEPEKWYLVSHAHIPDVRKVMQYQERTNLFIDHEGRRWCNQHVTLIGEVDITYY